MSKIKSIQEICLEFVDNRTEKTFKVAMDRLKPGIANHLMKIEKDYETRNYLMNITFAKMWTEIDKYDRSKAYFSTWIYKIAWNEALQHKRYTNRHSSLDSMVENSATALKNHSGIIESPVEFFDEIDDRDLITILYDEVIKSIDDIPNDAKNAKLKEILVLRLVKKLKYKDIAQEIDIPENTAKGRFKNSKKLVEKIIEQKNPELVKAFKKFIKE